MKREYFYKGSKGKVLPYHYCSECDKRFTDEESDQGLIVKLGLQASPIKLCKSPCLGIKFPVAVKKVPVWSLRSYDSELEPKAKSGRPKLKD